MRRAIIPAALVAAVAVLAACDDDDAGAPPGATGTPSQSAAETSPAGNPTPATQPTVTVATAAATTPAEATPSGTAAPPFDTSVVATLNDYTITLDRASVPAGRVRFIATNTSATEVHELAVLKIQPDGSFQERGIAQGVEPQQGASVTLTLEAGAYQLACLIKAGESSSEVDHYIEGMRTPFTVE